MISIHCERKQIIWKKCVSKLQFDVHPWDSSLKMTGSKIDFTFGA